MTAVSEHAPRFSLVVPAYNAARTLGATLDSLVAQSYTDYEIIVSDDGSTDATASLARSYHDAGQPVRVVSHENGGTGAAYRAGIEAARGAWIVICSADDVLLPDHLAQLASVSAAHPEAELLSTNGFFLEPDGTRVMAYPNLPPFPTTGCTLVNLVDACFFAVGAAFTRAAYDRVGGFSTDKYAEDYALFLRLMASGVQHAYGGLPTAVHRRSAEQKSQAALLMRREEIDDLTEVEEHFALSDAVRRAIARKKARLWRNIALRTRLAALVGEERAERVIRRARRRR